LVTKYGMMPGKSHQMLLPSNAELIIPEPDVDKDQCKLNS